MSMKVRFFVTPNRLSPLAALYGEWPHGRGLARACKAGVLIGVREATPDEERCVRESPRECGWRWPSLGRLLLDERQACAGGRRFVRRMIRTIRKQHLTIGLLLERAGAPVPKFRPRKQPMQRNRQAMERSIHISDADGRIVDTLEVQTRPRFKEGDLVIHRPCRKTAMVFAPCDRGYRCQYVDIERRGEETHVFIAVGGARFEVEDRELQPFPEALTASRPKPRTTAVRFEPAAELAPRVVDLVGERPALPEATRRLEADFSAIESAHERRTIEDAQRKIRDRNTLPPPRRLMIEGG